jgi:hypothetical protein
MSETVIALRVRDGHLAWAYRPTRNDTQCDSDFGATANAGLRHDGTADFLGVGSKDGTYYSLDPSTGKKRLATNVVFGGFSGGFVATAACDGRRVYGATAIGDFGASPARAVRRSSATRAILATSRCKNQAPTPSMPAQARSSGTSSRSSPDTELPMRVRAARTERAHRTSLDRDRATRHIRTSVLLLPHSDRRYVLGLRAGSVVVMCGRVCHGAQLG